MSARKLARFVGRGPHGGRLVLRPQRSSAFRRFLEWFIVHAEAGWAETTPAEAGDVIYPARWAGRDGKLNDPTQKFGEIRRWQWLGLVVVQPYGRLPDTIRIGLTAAGVDVARSIPLPVSVAYRIPLPVEAEPTPEPEPEPDLALTFDHEPEPEPEPEPDLPAAIAWLGHEAEHHGRLAHQFRFTARLLEPCNRQHVDDLDAEALFEQAVAKAQGRKAAGS